MSSSNVTGFEVISGGEGYTFATATLRYYNATATATIENGAITGWTVTNQGTAASVAAATSILESPGYGVIVSGDGDGGVAKPVFGTRSVSQVGFPPTEIWTSPPRVEVSGGGGSGVSINVSSSLIGTVKSISVTNPGSGYTQSAGEMLRVQLTHQGIVYDGGSVDLTPSKVVSVHAKVDTSSLPKLMKQSDGKLFPFTINSSNYLLASPWDGPQIESVRVVKNGGSEFPISNAGVSASTISGCRYPPFIKTYFSYPAHTTNSTAIHAVSEKLQDVCCTGSFCTYDVFVSPGVPPPSTGNSWPASGTGGTFSGNGSVTYKCIDGNNVETGRTWVEWGTRSSGGYSQPLPSDYTVTSTRYTGRIAAKVGNISVIGTTTQWPSEVSLYRGTVWSTPTIEHKSRIFFAPSSISGTAAYAEASPVGGDVVYGFGTSPTLISDGDALYDLEPTSLSITDTFEYPVVVGNESWKSVSISGQSSYGVTTGGALYWWGNNTACGRVLPCVSPSPVGQGATIDILATGELARFGDRGSSGAGLTNRVCLSVPDHGVYNVGNIEGSSIDASALSRLVEERVAFASNFAKASSYGVMTYFPPETNLWTRNGAFGGAGYTATPSAEFLYAGTAPATFTARLFGPSAFSEVREDCAKGTDGRWYHLGDPLGPQAVYKSPRKLYDYTFTYNGTFDARYSSTTGTRSIAREQYPTYIYVSNGGSGYSSASMSLALSRNAIDEYDPNSPTSQTFVVNSKETCGGGSEVVTSSTQTTTYSHPAASTITSTGELTIRHGAIAPSPASGTYIGYLNEGEVSASISGVGGSGGALSVVQFSQPFESHLLPLTPAGVESFSRSAGIGTKSSLLCSFPYTRYSYRTDGYYFPYDTGWASYSAGEFDGKVKVSGRSIRRDGDSSILRARSADVQTDLTTMAAYKVLSSSLTLESTGSGYGDVASATVSQQAGVATASAVYSASVMAIGVLNGGGGYTSPPEITLTASGGGTPGTATAVIAGPVSKINVTASGSGYRIPPRVSFSGVGIHAEATCTLNEAGGVESVSLSDGGRYRNSPPTVSFTPISQVESISLTSGGSGYTSAPDVFIGGGGGGVNATATATFKAKVVSVEVLNGGSGYSSTPTVSFSGGGGAGASATVSVSESGAVTGISIVNEGDGYTSAPSVFISGGGGSGATAKAKISGSVDSITLTSRGEDFSIPPTIVFYNGGGGSGASATATLSSPGSGAAATATLNGSVMFCAHSGSSGLQEEPVATVSHSSNYIISDLNARFSSGEINQQEFDRGFAAAAARLKTRISGSVSSVTVTSSGNSYKQSTDYTNLPGYMEKKLPGIAQIRGEMAEYASSGARAGDTIVLGNVSGGGISSFTTPSILSQLRFWKKPEVAAIDGISAIPSTCLTLRSAAVRSAGTNSGTITRGPVVGNGVFSAAITNASAVDSLIMSGAFSSQSFSQSYAAFYRQYYANAYSTKPTVTLEDEAGSGATVGAMDAATIVSGGDGYTLGARLVIKGGTPYAWTSPADAVATVSNGSVTSISVINSGRGYLTAPSVFIVGGGGTGARAEANLSPGPNFQIASITVTNAGRGYTSTPTVIVVDNERPFQFSAVAKALGYVNGIRAVEFPVLQDYKVEFCLVSRANQGQMTITSPVGLIPGNYNARFVPFFEDDGYVEGILWSYIYSGTDGYFCGVRNFTQAPTVTAVGPCSGPATFSTKIEGWSDVFSENALKLAD